MARLLGEPQYRLIQLCIEGSLRRDIDDADGRGSNREFSRRNVVEMAAAIEVKRERGRQGRRTRNAGSGRQSLNEEANGG